MWLRVLAFACLLLLTGASSLQAAHIHGELLPHQQTLVDAPADASQLPGGEDRCPLCVAMHSALPAVVRLEPAQLVLVECRLAAVAECAHESQWHFAMFSRPPPPVEMI